MKVFQCSDCNPHCVFPYKEGYTKPVMCAFWEVEHKLEANYEIKEITEEELLELFK